MSVETVESTSTTPPAPAKAPSRAKAAKSAPAPTPDVRPSTLQAAYAEAKAQHSDPVSEPAPPSVEPTATETDTTPTQSKAPEPDASSPAPEPTFLSDEEFAALQTEHQDDPAEFRKALDKRFNKALTTSTQKLSALRKSLEPFVDVLDGLDTDPASTIRALATKHGVTLAEKPAAVSQPTETSADALTIAKEALGPELDFLAEKLAPAIDRILDRKLATTFEPVKARLHEQDQRTAQEEVSRELKSFETKYPNWKQHESRMTELAQSFPPSGNVTESQWMESLYKLATFDDAMAQGEAKAIQRMSKGAKTSEISRPAVSESHVRPAMPANAKFRDAYNAAKDGQRW